LKKLLLTLLVITAVIFTLNGMVRAATVVWTGPKFTFSKANYADYDLLENQDRITDNVWITRQNGSGIFNIKTESDYTDAVSPADTEWAYGSAADWASLTFSDWETWHDGCPPEMVGKEAVVHLKTDDIYIDIKFLSWSCGECVGGGGFSYERSTPGGVSATVWTGPKSTFSKAPDADWTLLANQDHITDNVWITRQNGSGIFNIKDNPDYTDNDSPVDTEWAYGSAADWASLTFSDWETWHHGCPLDTLGKEAVVHLITDDIYIDIKFLTWSCGECVGGGGFSYVRSTSTTVPKPSRPSPQWYLQSSPQWNLSSSPQWNLFSSQQGYLPSQQWYLPPSPQWYLPPQAWRPSQWWLNY